MSAGELRMDPAVDFADFLSPGISPGDLPELDRLAHARPLLSAFTTLRPSGVVATRVDALAQPGLGETERPRADVGQEPFQRRRRYGGRHRVRRRRGGGAHQHSLAAGAVNQSRSDHGCGRCGCAVAGSGVKVNPPWIPQAGTRHGASG